MVTIEKLEGGAFRVSRVLPCGASMQAAASALERVVPEAFAAEAPEPGSLDALRIERGAVKVGGVLVASNGARFGIVAEVSTDTHPAIELRD